MKLPLLPKLKPHMMTTYKNAINNLVKVTPAEPTTPNTPNANKKDDVKQGNVKTGDNTNIALYTSLFIMGALVLPLVLKKKRHN